MVRTQYFSEEIDAEGGMFPPERLALMRGSHSSLAEPEPGKIYAITIDVAGEDEGAQGIGEDGVEELSNPKRDSTAVTIFEVDLSTLPAGPSSALRSAQDALGAPTYRAVCRYNWTGKKHTRLYNVLRDLAQTWQVEFIVIDSTGVGAGLASFMDKSFPGRVIPFQFTAQSKSKLGWAFLAVIETGRYKEYAPIDGLLWMQLKYTQHQVIEGPAKMLRWSVPDGTRDEITGEFVHDDLVISAALVAVLDDQEWAVSGAPVVVRGADPLAEMDREGF